ncbi:MAG: HU family DNA-binding protein [Myxococcota bacterium]|jgi:integration host factor subunit beta|nr:HU family DNA-binding protein [Myxococcota bacterium]
MNKSKLIELVAEQSEISKKNAEQAVNVIFTTLKDALIEGERIEIRGFGSFITKEYRAYTGRNPRTGRAIHVPAKRLPFFKVGKDLRERINDD